MFAVLSGKFFSIIFDAFAIFFLMCDDLDSNKGVDGFGIGICLGFGGNGIFCVNTGSGMMDFGVMIDLVCG
jgi:hypothetical protein